MSKNFIDREKLSSRQRNIFDQVEKLYNSTQREIAVWLWKNHVQVVANYALELAKKYQADADLAFAGALLHDVADIWHERNEASFEEITAKTARQVLNQAGYDHSLADKFYSQIIEPHSVRLDGKQPNNLEAKILATADAMAHLTTDFYLNFQKMGYPTSDKTEFKDWVLAKLERDFHRKIFFPEIKAKLEPYYAKLKKHFSQL